MRSLGSLRPFWYSRSLHQSGLQTYGVVSTRRIATSYSEEFYTAHFRNSFNTWWNIENVLSCVMFSFWRQIEMHRISYYQLRFRNTYISLQIDYFVPWTLYSSSRICRIIPLYCSNGRRKFSILINPSIFSHVFLPFPSSSIYCLYPRSFKVRWRTRTNVPYAVYLYTVHIRYSLEELTDVNRAIHEWTDFQIHVQVQY